jgi:hypothetical protein
MTLMTAKAKAESTILYKTIREFRTSCSHASRENEMCHVITTTLMLTGTLQGRLLYARILVNSLSQRRKANAVLTQVKNGINSLKEDIADNPEVVRNVRRDHATDATA